MKLRWTISLLLLLTLAGCRRDEGDPEQSAAYAQARRAGDSGDWKAAATFYRRVIDEHPQFARAHRELGLLYDEKLGDPLAAIYHYRRYIELEPNPDKRRVVEDFVDRAKLSLASKLPQQPGVDTGDLVRLQNQNTALAADVAALKAKLAEREAVTNAPPPVAFPTTNSTMIVAVATNTVPDAGKPRIHVVQKGDTLFSIALRYYGSRSGAEKIYQANRATMSSRDHIRLGQQLVIP